MPLYAEFYYKSLFMAVSCWTNNGMAFTRSMYNGGGGASLLWLVGRPME